MAEKVKIRIHPSGTSSDMLTVADAMRQVLDFIELLERADATDKEAPGKVVWRLSYATTNSPFEVGAEATSRDPSLSVAIKAHLTKTAVRNAVNGILFGMPPPSWFDESCQKVTERLLERNTNGIGRTDIDFGDDVEPTIVVHSNAQAGLIAMEEARLAARKNAPDLTRTEYGSFEGEIISTGMYHNNPAVVVRDRLTDERVTCVFPAELAYRIGSQHNWFEIWAGKRILVHGELHYDSEGVLKKADAIDLEPIEPREIDLNEARRLDLLEGMSVSEFLDRGWSGLDG